MKCTRGPTGPYYVDPDDPGTPIAATLAHQWPAPVMQHSEWVPLPNGGVALWSYGGAPQATAWTGSTATMKTLSQPSTFSYDGMHPPAPQLNYETIHVAVLHYDKGVVTYCPKTAPNGRVKATLAPPRQPHPPAAEITMPTESLVILASVFLCIVYWVQRGHGKSRRAPKGDRRLALVFV